MSLPLIVSILYIILLTFVLLIAKHSTSKFAKTKSQQCNIMVVFHAFLVSALAILYFAQFEFVALYNNPFDAILKSLFGMGISYSIVSTLYYLMVLKRKDKHIIFHHITTSLSSLYIIVFFNELPMYWGLTVLVQFNPFFYHTYLILKETTGVQQMITRFWYDLNYYMWIFIRVVLLFSFFVVGIYAELTMGSMGFIDRLATLSLIGLFLYFSINWLFIMVRNRKKMALKEIEETNLSRVISN